MKRESIKQWFSRVFTRDINIPLKTFVYLLFSLLAIMLIVEALVIEFISEIRNVGALGIEIYLFVIIIVIAFLISGIFVDFIKNRTRYFNLTLLICVIGLLIRAIPSNFLMYIGSLIVSLTISNLIIVWFTILVHETTILNRGRISTYLLIPSFTLGAIPIIFIKSDFFYIFFGILEFCIFLIIFWYSRSYKYIETKDRLKSDKKYLNIIFEKHLVIFGFIFSRWIVALPGIDNFIPNFPNLLNSFLLVILLVWMMGMKEFLASKEKKWAHTLNSLLVFSKSGVCLYNHNFRKKDQAEDKEDKTQFDQDLVSGALTGIITIISEITHSKKQLRKIDKEGGFLLFGYGKYHVVALIASMELPVLFKKIDEFSREFENIFLKELRVFQGNVNRFVPTKYLIKKYFSQKYTEFEL